MVYETSVQHIPVANERWDIYLICLWSGCRRAASKRAHIELVLFLFTSFRFVRMQIKGDIKIFKYTQKYTGIIERLHMLQTIYLNVKSSQECLNTKNTHVHTRDSKPPKRLTPMLQLNAINIAFKWIFFTPYSFGYVVLTQTMIWRRWNKKAETKITSTPSAVAIIRKEQKKVPQQQHHQRYFFVFWKINTNVMHMAITY